MDKKKIQKLIPVLTITILAAAGLIWFGISSFSPLNIAADRGRGNISEIEPQTEQDFLQGVLAVNVNKSIYLPGEQAYIQMTVLDKEGRAVCDAQLKLKVKSPKLKVTEFSTTDGTIQYSGKCRADNVTDVPDYYTYYKIPNQVGTYQMKLTNLDTGYEIEDSFEVREGMPFDVERIGPTRIYPPATYEMVIRIKANQDFKGEIIETVPMSFEVAHETDTKQNTKRHENTKEIIWDVDWKTGERYELEYTFKAADVSPYLYLLGPLRFEQ